MSETCSPPTVSVNALSLAQRRIGCYVSCVITRMSKPKQNPIAVELLRSLFYLCVAPHITTLLSVETNRHSQVP